MCAGCLKIGWWVGWLLGPLSLSRWSGSLMIGDLLIFINDYVTMVIIRNYCISYISGSGEYLIANLYVYIYIYPSILSLQLQLFLPAVYPSVSWNPSALQLRGTVNQTLAWKAVTMSYHATIPCFKSSIINHVVLETWSFWYYWWIMLIFDAMCHVSEEAWSEILLTDGVRSLQPSTASPASANPSTPSPTPTPNATRGPGRGGGHRGNCRGDVTSSSRRLEERPPWSDRIWFTIWLSTNNGPFMVEFHCNSSIVHQSDWLTMVNW